MYDIYTFCNYTHDKKKFFIFITRLKYFDKTDFLWSAAIACMCCNRNPAHCVVWRATSCWGTSTWRRSTTSAAGPSGTTPASTSSGPARTWTHAPSSTTSQSRYTGSATARSPPTTSDAFTSSTHSSRLGATRNFLPEKCRKWKAVAQKGSHSFF